MENEGRYNGNVGKMQMDVDTIGLNHRITESQNRPSWINRKQ